MQNNRRLISLKNIPRINLPHHIVQGTIVAVGDDGVGLGLEGFEVVHDAAAEEGGAVFQGGLENDDLGALGLDALDVSLNFSSRNKSLLTGLLVLKLNGRFLAELTNIFG